MALISFWMLRINCGEPFGAEAAGVCMCARELKKTNYKRVFTDKKYALHYEASGNFPCMHPKILFHLSTICSSWGGQCTPWTSDMDTEKQSHLQSHSFLTACLESPVNLTWMFLRQCEGQSTWRKATQIWGEDANSTQRGPKACLPTNLLPSPLIFVHHT